MPTSRHDSLCDLFFDRPELAAELLREWAGVRVPDGPAVHLSTATLNDRVSRDLIPDNTFGIGQAGDPRYVIITEVQNEPLVSKLAQMARYAAAIWLTYRCNVKVPVVCPTQAVARFYARPYHTELDGYVFTAVPLGPDEMPAITDPAVVAARPDVAAVAMSGHADPTVIQAFLDGLRDLPPEQVDKYIESAHRICGPDARRILEGLMPESRWVVSTPFAKEHFGKGLAEGEARGEARGEANAVLTILEERQIEIPQQVRRRISSCTDIDEIDKWVRRAITASCADDLFS